MWLCEFDLDEFVYNCVNQVRCFEVEETCKYPMSPEEELQSNVSVASSSPTSNCISRNTSGGLKEHNYLGLSDCSSVGSSTLSSLAEDDKATISLKATELTLGLPGSRSPVRDTDLNLLSPVKLDEKPFFPLLPTKDEICSSSLKNIGSGNKRGFSDTMDHQFAEAKSSVYTEKNWMFPEAAAATQSVTKKDVPQNIPKGQSSTTNNSSSPPAAKYD